MTPFLILDLQSTLSLVAFALIGRWHIAPRLAGKAIEDYLLPLTWLHVFRFAPLTLLVPGQVPNAPADAASLIAYGDLISALLALAAVIFLKYRLAGAVLLAWLFNIVGSVDIVQASAAAVSAKLSDLALGFNWYIVSFYVPALAVTHAMMIYRLIRNPAPRSDRAFTA